MDSLSPQVVFAAKLPILNPNEFDLWKIRIEQYFLMSDYSLWEVILNGDSPVPTRVVEDAKTLMESIEKRFGGNIETKKVQKTILKQQYENFTGLSSESLDQIHDRLQKLVSQFEIHGVSLSQEDVNLKFLRSLPSEWKTHTLIWRNKADLEEQSLDDFTTESVSAVASVFAICAKMSVSSLPNVDSLSNAAEILKLMDLHLCVLICLKWSAITAIGRDILQGSVGLPRIQEGIVLLSHKEGLSQHSVETSIPAATPKSASPKPASSGTRRNRKTCFVCKSVDHLIKVCDYHAKKMAHPTTRNLAHRVSAAMPQIKVTRPSHAKPIVTKSNSPIRRHVTHSPSPKTSNSHPRVTAVKAPVVSVAQGVIDSGCSRHMTRNMSYLSDFKELNGGYVTFRGNPKGGKISRKGKIKTGKFDGKVDEGFLAGYSVSSKAFRVFNSRTCIVQETLHVIFLENKPNITGSSPTWLFDIDSLTRTMHYQPVTVGNQTNPSNNDGDAAFDGKEPDIDAKKPESKVNVSPSSSAQSRKQDDKTKKEAKGKKLKDITYSDDKDDVGAEADFNNLETSITVSPIPTTRVHKDHHVSQIIGDLSSTTQTRSMTRVEEPKRVHQALKYPSWIEAMQEELLQFKMQKVWVLVDLPHEKRAIGTKWGFRNKKDERGIIIRNKGRLVAQGHTQEEGIDYEDVFAPVARTEAIRLFLAYASFMGFIVYQMDVKNAFLYRIIEEEVYVCQTPGLEDPDHPDKVYKVVEALYEGKSASTPIDTEKPLLKDPDGEDIDVHTYRSMIGSLMYLTSSRPDIMFAVCTCAHFYVTPKASHHHALKRIFRYLKGKPHLGLWYPDDSPFDLVAYSYSDFAGASLDIKSTTGGCQFLGCILISWQCKKQRVVATSSTKAEYVATASCNAQVLWIQNQLLDYSDSPLLGVNTPRSDEDRLELMELMIFLLPKVEKVRIGVNTVDLQVSDVNDVTRLQALVDKKKVVVTESTIREALRLDDAEDVDCLPNEEIFTELARMGYEKPSTKITSSMASAVICLSTEQEVDEEGDADDNVEEVNAGDAAKGEDSAAHEEVSTVAEE
nr:ribonuclease H-like domain-containing protein [Tanacetum cinerariifolium]